MALGLLTGLSVGAGAALGSAAIMPLMMPFNAANNFLGSAYFGYGMIIGERYAYQEDWPKIQKRLLAGENINSIMHEYAGRFSAMVMAEAKAIYETTATKMFDYIAEAMNLGNKGTDPTSTLQQQAQYSPDTRGPPTPAPAVNTGGNSAWTASVLSGAVATAKTLIGPERAAQFSPQGQIYEGPGGPLSTQYNKDYQGELARRATIRPQDPPEPLPQPRDLRTAKRVKDLQYSIDLNVAKMKKLKATTTNANRNKWNASMAEMAKDNLRYTNELDNITKGEIFRGFNPLYVRTSTTGQTVTLAGKAPAATYYDPTTKTQKIASRGPYYYNN